MLGDKLGLSAAAAKGGRATEQYVAAFDLKTCRAQFGGGPGAQQCCSPGVSVFVPCRARSRAGARGALHCILPS